MKENPYPTPKNGQQKIRKGNGTLIESSMIEEDIEDIEFNVDDRDQNEREIFMTVGLNSNISAADFKRKKLNLVILLDISGSMNKPFENETQNIGYYGNVSATKMQVACKSLIALLTHLKYDDRIGLVLFNKNVSHRFYLTELKSLPFYTIRQILAIGANGGTDFEAGFNACIDQYRSLFKKLKLEKNIKPAEKPVNETPKNNDDENNGGSTSPSPETSTTDLVKEGGDNEDNKQQENDVDDTAEGDPEYDNRIIVLTDMCPTKGKKGSGPLMKLVKKYAEKKGQKIYTTFIGVGLDFNTDLVGKISKVRGCNYMSVHNNTEFVKRLDAEFDYMVSPLVFNLRLTLKSEGDAAYIAGVYGSDDVNDLKNGEVMSIKTLFPSPVNDDGDTKGGIVLLKIKRKDSGDDSKKTFSMIVECEFEDKYEKKYVNKQIVEFGSENKYNNDDYYDNNGVQKGILLTRYVTLMRQWIIHDRLLFYPKNYLNKNIKVTVSNKYKKIFKSFMRYYQEEYEKIGDKEMKKELELMDKICSDGYLKAAKVYQPPKAHINKVIYPRKGYKRGRPYNIDCNNNNITETKKEAINFDFESLEAGIKLVDINDNKWTLEPDISIIDDININFEKLSDEELKKYYDCWLKQGLAEHASIASFSRFSLDLISLGAPSFLIELVHKGTLDEIRHSKIAFDVANIFLSAIGDEDNNKCINPSKIQSHNIQIDGNCQRILNDLINGGCFNELISALQSVTDAINLKSNKLLHSIALDETKHCSLAWIAMIWIIQNKENVQYEYVDIQTMYKTQLQDIDDDKESLYAFNVVIPEIMDMIFHNDGKQKRDYQSLYQKLLNKLQDHIEIFRKESMCKVVKSMCDII